MTLNLSASPHVRDRWTTSFIMHTVLISLLPAAAVGVAVALGVGEGLGVAVGAGVTWGDSFIHSHSSTLGSLNT